MTKLIIPLLLLTFLFPACNNGQRIPLLNYDAGSICNDNDISRLRSDFFNCGVCGNTCSADASDRCIDGICVCGTSNNSCQDPDVCISSRCVTPDNSRPCLSSLDCPNDSGGQQCIVDLSLMGHCVDACEFSDQCPSGFVCASGACTRFQCTPETCDGIDNDCDGIVDESIDDTGPLSRWCWSGGDATVPPLPPCQRGRQTCTLGGVWTNCEEEIGPRPEIGLLACNSKDDNCDGCVDGVVNESGACVTSPHNGFDVLYIIDVSGSMATTISTVQEATSRFSSIYAGDPEFRFGLVVIAGNGSLNRHAYVAQDFTDFTTFNSNLSTLLSSGGGTEPSFDAVYESATGEIVHGIDTDGDGDLDNIDETRTGLAWRTASIRIMIMFTDEIGQSTRADFGKSPVDESVMCSSLTHGETLIVFGKPENQNDFNDCGTWYLISMDPDVMVSSLSGVIVDPCL